MSNRSGYNYDADTNWPLIRWRGAVKSALRGARGQAFLREMLAALDAMPVKSLITDELQAYSESCALGAVGQARGLDLSEIDAEDWPRLAETFGIAEAMAREIMFENDDCVNDFDWINVEICGPVRPFSPDWGLHQRCVRVPAKSVGERRWSHMRSWVVANLKAAA